MKNFDVAILGSGPASGEIAAAFTKQGKSVCVIEKDPKMLGGVCANKGCMPTKFLVKAAETVEESKKAQNFGIDVTYQVQIDQILTRKNNFVQMLNEMHQKHKNYELILGFGKFISNDMLEITLPDGSYEKVTAEHFVIATGSRPKLIPGINMDEKFIVTSNEFLDNEVIPEKLLVVGGGAIGLEFASIYNSFGSDVTLIEAAERIVPNEDADTSRMAKELLEKHHIKIHTNTWLNQASIQDNKVLCTILGDHACTDSFNQVLICIGRQPNTDNIGLENTDIKTEHGFIAVNEYLQTSVPQVYAVGDVIQTAMLAHTAVYESSIAALNLLAPQSMKYENKVTPRVIFSNPEIASVGLTEAEARAAYEKIDTIDFPMAMSGKAMIENSVEGRVKMIYHADSHVILGANIIGKSATELIHELTLAVTNKMTIEELKNTVHAHPTLSEVLWFAVLRSMKQSSAAAYRS